MSDYWWIPLLAHGTGLVLAIFAIMGTRTSQGAVAWVISLITIPYLAVPAYWVLGRNKFKGYVLAKRSDLAEIEAELADATASARDLAASLGATNPGLRSAEVLARMPATGGNEVDLLIDGEATFSSLFEGIEKARRYVLVQFYIVRADDIGNELKARLCQLAARGIQVCFLYDEIGSWQLPATWLKEMRDAGVAAFPFYSQKGYRNRFQLNFRNHRKIVVVDGEACWIGGHNVGDEYLGRDRKVGHWRDTHLRITGPATIAAQMSFAEDWHWATDTLPDGLEWRPTTRETGQTAMLIVPSGPADELETAGLLHQQAISSAERRIWIASPYFVPDEGIIGALQLACLRGVDVRIIVPDKTDNLVVTLATWSFFDELHSAGARFFRHRRGFMHQKALLVDDLVAAVGTANFDNRSFRLNFEITAIGVGDAYFTAVESMFEMDLGDSVEMAPDAFRSKSLAFRLAARASRLSAPLL